MVTTHGDCYPDGIKKMMLADPYTSVHIRKSSKSDEYLKKLKELSGVEPKKGCWCPSEVKQLKENMKLFQSLNPNVDIIKLLYEKKSIEKTRILNKTCFWNILAFNLCRTLDSVYRSLVHYYMKHAGFKTGAWSKQECSYLKELVEKHGHNWMLISKLMNRSSGSLRPAYCQNIKNNVNKGPWHNDEKKRFFHIAKILMQYNQRQGSSLHKLNWTIMSDFVKTRGANACLKFAASNKDVLENFLLHNGYTLLSQESMVLYLYFSKVQSCNEIDFKELTLLFDCKFTETELREELKQLIPVLTNDNLPEIIKTQFKYVVHAAVVLFQRINFSNVLVTMKIPRTIAWLKAKYYLLVKENISEYENKTSEEMITMLHKRYCSDKAFEKNEDTSEQEACILDSNEISINSGVNKTTIPSIDLMSDDEDESVLVGLTLSTDKNDDVTNDVIADDDDVTNDFDVVIDDNDDVTNDFDDVIDDNDDAYNITDVMIID